jgi:peptide chain release factor
MPISSPKKAELVARMSACGLLEKDIVESFIRGSGSGGQKLNKSATCVYLKHVPSGLEVKCAKTRSRAENRFFARRALLEKLECLQNPTAAPKMIARQKIKKQKKRRARRSKKSI